MRLPRLQAFALAAVAAGCGGGASVGPPVATQRSFDVSAALAPANGEGGEVLPSPNLFTLVLDPTARRIIVGAAGEAAVVPVTTADGRTFRTTKAFSVGRAPQSACDILTKVTYNTLEVTIADSTLNGRGSGSLTLSCGDCEFQKSFSAVLSGAPDVTTPFLVAIGGSSLDPFTPLTFAASEPLPATATARLVAGDGSSLDLEPQIVPGDVPLVTTFTKPDVVLHYGDGYIVALDGLVDFAGQAGSTDAGLRLAGRPAPPLAAEDGFESVAVTTFGGASVVVEPAVVVSGSRSLYIGGLDAPTLGSATPGGLVVRLSVQPDDTKVTFLSRGLGKGPVFSAGGQVNVGSIGHEASFPGFISAVGGIPVPVEDSNGVPLFVTLTITNEFPLPADHGDEVVVSISSRGLNCGNAPPGAGLLIDDLRAE